MTVRTVGAIVAVLMGGCSSYHHCSGAPAVLFDGLVSQASQGAVRLRLGSDTPWRVVSEDPNPPGRRPPFNFVLVDVGEREHLGQRGGVQLWFFNDRLYSVYFTPRDPPTYFSKVEAMPGAHISNRPSGVVLELPGNARVSLVGSGPGQTTRVEWYDECLRLEHDSWLWRYS